MNASYRWLADFLDGAPPPAEVREILTARCATVEDMTPVRADLGDVVIARVVSVEKHPEAEKLTLTRVDAGTGELLEVVCGAPNVSAGTLYPFVHVGATLPGGVKIEKRKIRGRISNGMLCSERELGLGADYEGIMALDVDAAPGARFLDVVSAGDFRFAIDVLPNRPDLLSHEGLAREIAAATGTKFGNWRARDAKVAASPRTVMGSSGARIVIEDDEACPRYVAVVIRGVRVGESPPWLRERLGAIGARAINSVVDVTNFMLHGYGQPMHAFDAVKLGNEVRVRRARAGEKLTTLDGVDRTLDETMLVIAGARDAEAIAGVIGGERTAVSDVTTDILLEVAAFEPRSIRRARRKLGISTDASYRFERGVDATRAATLAAIAANLIVETSGGKVAGAAVDAHPRPSKPRTVKLRPARADLVLGEEIAAARMASYLKLVGFKSMKAGAALRVTVPSWRGDVATEVDLIEEIARLHGYDAFPSDLRPYRPSAVPEDPVAALADELRSALTAAGLLEIRPMPFVADGPDALRVRNPLAESEAFLRRSLLATLAGRAEHNLAHGQRSVRLFEIGTVFAAGEAAIPAESTRVAALIMGEAEPPHFTNPTPRAFDSWDLKAIAEAIVSVAFTTDDLKFNVRTDLATTLSGGDALHRILWSIVLDGRPIGAAGLLQLDAPPWAAPAYGVEIDLSSAAARRATRSAPITTTPIPAFPAIEIDLALLVPSGVTAERVEALMRRDVGGLLESVAPFDEYKGTGVDAGARSVAWRLTFRHSDRTLREQEVDARVQKLLRSLQEELGVRQRTS